MTVEWPFSTNWPPNNWACSIRMAGSIGSKVQGSSDYKVDEKYEILTAWETVKDTIWEKDDD